MHIESSPVFGTDTTSFHRLYKMAEGLLRTRPSHSGSVNNISVPKVEMLAWIPRASEATHWVALSDPRAPFICAIGGDSPVELCFSHFSAFVFVYCRFKVLSNIKIPPLKIGL